MVRVEDEIFIRAPLSEVFRCFWDAELWPLITPHVKCIEMLEAAPEEQRFRMTVESGGRSHTVETARKAHHGRAITYEQSKPPAFLKQHSGLWSFTEEDAGVRVCLAHNAEINEEGLALLGAASASAAEEMVGRTLRANGMRTMQAVKAYIER